MPGTLHIWRPPRPRFPLGALGVVLLLLALAAAAIPPAAVAASAGKLYAFGLNRYGQLGIETNSGAFVANPTPAPVTLPGAEGPVTQVAAGQYHSLALTSTGQLYAFGENGYGQLGVETNSGTSRPNPTPAPVSLPGAEGPVTQVAAGQYHSLALTSTGQLYAFGDNYYGQLGSETHIGTEEPNPTPTLVSLPGAEGPVSEIAAGGYHSLALTSTGQLYAFGDNRYGQLGIETNSGTEEPNPTPTLVSLPGAEGPVTQIAAGAEHSLALTSTGQLYAFGYNRLGQLGSSANNEPNPTPAPVSLPGAEGPVTQVAAGQFHSLALTSTGQLYAFGENYNGQLGSEAHIGTTEPNPTPTPVSLSGASGPVTQIAAGRQDSLALTSTGQLYAFGDNYNGQLGIETNSGTSHPDPTPTLVDLGAGTVITMAAGSMALHALVVVDDLLVTTGSLPSGQVGAPYSVTAAATGGTAPYTWQASGLPAGLSIDPASGQISGTPSAAGTSQVTLTVTDHFGIVASSGPLELSVEAPPSVEVTPSIEAPPSVEVTPSSGPAPSAESVPGAEASPGAARPQVLRLRESHRRWRPGKELAKVSSLPGDPLAARGARRPPLGTTFRFRLNEKAGVRLTFEVRKGRRFKKVGALGFAGRKGANEVAFQGRISRRRTLRPGRYELIVTARHGSRRSKPRTLRFTIVA